LIRNIQVNGEIRLDQFLKWSRLASTGGQGKILISNNHVKVNGEIENRRSRKLKDGDLVEVTDLGSFRVVFN
jgi:ribosome-associated protein